ncbi:unnamed protein product [Trifolium pratense]|uniref:Uncharacterized protein n=1 Tax=Trifolium pratense TaxID=57577 RepID=A0ACB0K2V9_TRIPR|nr:unnamed protein product [Trifolium pratense]
MCGTGGRQRFTYFSYSLGIKQREVYGGDMAVIDVMKFAAEHGSNFYHLMRESNLNEERMDETHLQIQGRPREQVLAEKGQDWKKYSAINTGKRDNRGRERLEDTLGNIKSSDELYQKYKVQLENFKTMKKCST